MRVCVSERCFALGVAAGYYRQGCECCTHLYTHSSRADVGCGLEQLLPICHWEAATGSRREERGSRQRGEKEKWLSMDVLQDWALAYPALARLLWVILLVLATLLVWSLFFCCWGNQSSTSPLERYLSGNTAAFILTQLIWKQFLLMFFSCFQISRNSSVWGRKKFLQWKQYAGFSWLTAFSGQRMVKWLCVLDVIWRGVLNPQIMVYNFSSSIPKLNVPWDVTQWQPL